MQKLKFYYSLIFSFFFLAAIPSEFTDCFGSYSPDAAAAAAMHYQFNGSYPTAPHGKIRTKHPNIFVLRYSLLDIFGSYAQMSQFRNPMMMMMHPGGYPVPSSPTDVINPVNHHHHHQQQESSAVTSGAS